MKDQTKRLETLRAQQKVGQYILEQQKKRLDGCALPVVNSQDLLFAQLLPLLKNPQIMAQA
ncbi:MAG: hypothetical protein ACE5DP_00190 [Fidelibacterota bacterium]